MTTYVLDTNIVSFYLKGNETVEKNIIRALTNRNNILIAPIAYYEIKRGLLAVNSQRRLKEFDNFCQLFRVGQLDNSVLDTAANIYVEQRRTGFVMEDADIFIAAFCKSQSYALVVKYQ